MRRSIALLFAVALTTALSAQDYKVEVRLVEIEVRVTDRSGTPVVDLTRADFTLKEDGVAHDVATAQYLPVPFETTAKWEATPAAPAEAVADAPVTPTWIYVATEVSPNDANRTIAAIREFLLTKFRPGFKVSLAGRAFTDDRAKLLETLNRLERSPLGTNGQPGLVDLARPLNDDAAEERALASTFRRQQEGTAPLPGFFARQEAAEVDGSFARPFLTMGRADRQLPVYGDVTLNQYYDLVERLAPLPGKKAVVLMRPGLRLEPDNQGLFQDLASFAVRRRVAFYTVDSRGLDAQAPVEERNIPFMIDRRRRVGEPDLIGQMQERALMREGLDNLARETGGRSLIGTNRLSDVFQKVAEDASGYYVVSYYPIDHRQAGRFRGVKVDVTRPGVKVQQTTRGYYETRPQSLFTKDDRGLALRRAMQMATAPVDLPMAATVGHFASDDGFPVLVLSAGVPASALTPQKDKGGYQLATSAIVRVADADRSRLPMYFERRLDTPLDQAGLDRTKVDRTAFVAMTDLLPLLPGTYEWRIVFRDEKTGRMGGADGKVSLKDFRAPSTPSTLLLTRQVTRRPAAVVAAGTGPDRQPLDVGELRFSAQPSLVFHKGELVHLLYTVYNATPEDMATAKKGMQLALFQAGKPVTNVKVFGEPVVDEGRSAIQYTGGIDTDSLAPGVYTVVGMLPNFETRSVKQVEQRFMLIDAPSGS
jgi:VWFA-related protein